MDESSATMVLVEAFKSATSVKVVWKAFDCVTESGKRLQLRDFYFVGHCKNPELVGSECLDLFRRIEENMKPRPNDAFASCIVRWAAMHHDCKTVDAYYPKIIHASWEFDGSTIDQLAECAIGADNIALLCKILSDFKEADVGYGCNNPRDHECFRGREQSSDADSDREIYPLDRAKKIARARICLLISEFIQVARYTDMCVKVKELLPITTNFNVLYKISVEMEKENWLSHNSKVSDASVLKFIRVAALKGVLEENRFVNDANGIPLEVLRRIAIKAIISRFPD